MYFQADKMFELRSVYSTIHIELSRIRVVCSFSIFQFHQPVRTIYGSIPNLSRYDMPKDAFSAHQHAYSNMHT